jgi:hypothetical protein
MKFISLDDAATLIFATARDKKGVFALLGEPGIGKTSLIRKLAEMTGFNVVDQTDQGLDLACSASIMNVPSTDIADVGVPMPDHETKTTELYPNSHWGFHTGKPMILCLDEFSKGSKPLQTILHPLLYKDDGTHRRIGAFKIHPDSIVFITGNLTTDGVGDSLAAHTNSRLTKLYIRKPNNDEWCEWAIDAGLAPELITWTKVNPRLFASYTDGHIDDNDYVFNPTNAAQRGNPYVTPRSLAECSPIVYAYTEGRINYTQCDAALQGTIGVSAARDLMAQLDLGQQLPTPAEIRANPAYATVPQSAPAQIMCVINALKWVPGDMDKIDADVRTDLDAWFTYMVRLPKEAQAMFVETVNSVGKRAKEAGKMNQSVKLMNIMVTHKLFQKWATENHYLF